MLWSLVMALSQTRLYNCWQLTNKESGHCQPSPPPPSFFLLLRSVGIYIYIHFFRRGSAAGPCVLSYIYTTGPCTTTTTTINHPSTLILTCPAAAVAPKLRVSTHHYSVEKCVPHTHTERKAAVSKRPKFALRQLFFVLSTMRRQEVE